MSESGQVAVIIPAAGRGTRLGGHRKQFRVLGGKSVLVQTLLVFERHSEVDHIVVATPEEAVGPLREELVRVGISKLHDVVGGGDTRQESVHRALMALPEAVDVVLVHDAVRPFVRMSRVSAVVRSVRQSGAGSLAISISDTVRKMAAGQSGEVLFAETVPREELVRMQTPQGFRRDWLIEAHDKAFRGEIQATDDVALVQHTGHDVVCVPGCQYNIKITTPQDWEQALRFWNYWASVLQHEEREQIVGKETR